jgi:hypothetical protein
MQVRSDGRYDVVCSDGAREIVTATDLHANNLCPNSTNHTPSEIQSIIRNADGTFSVICKNSSHVTVSEAEILGGKVCTGTFPGMLKSGVYSPGSYSTFCDQKITVLDSSHLTLKYLGGCADITHEFECKNGLCGNGQVKILNDHSYVWEPAEGQVFTLIE